MLIMISGSVRLYADDDDDDDDINEMMASHNITHGDGMGWDADRGHVRL